MRLMAGLQLSSELGCRLCLLLLCLCLRFTFMGNVSVTCRMRIWVMIGFKLQLTLGLE
jgi:hypothetical protein